MEMSGTEFTNALSACADVDVSRIDDGDDSKEAFKAVESANIIAEDKENSEEEVKKKKRKKKKRKEPGQWKNISKSTSVYVSGLPSDTKEVELVKRFSMYGVIKKDIEGQHRVKVYRDKETNECKGDGLVTFLRTEAAENCVLLADGDLFREKFEMKVTEAQFEKKEGFVPSSMKKSQRTRLNQQKAVLGWDEHAERLSRTLVFSNMFEPIELIAPNATIELQDDIEEELRSKYGKSSIESVKVFEHNPAGIVIVKFFESSDATTCAEAFNHRWFGGKKISCEFYDGVKDYNCAEDPKLAEMRSKAFHEWLAKKSSSS